MPPCHLFPLRPPALRRLGPVLSLLLLFLFPAAGWAKTPTTSGTGAASSRPLYDADVAGNRSVRDGPIAVAPVGQLQPRWRIAVGGSTSGTPIIAHGTVYLGSYDGTLRTRDLQTGAARWTYDTGARVQEPNLKIRLGIPGSAAVAGGMVDAGNCAATVHALDAATGALRWKVTVDHQPHACIWSSPPPWQGRLYVSVASLAVSPVASPGV